MALRFYNTLGRAKQDFIPLSPDQVKIYTCGPTVYDFAHLGNFFAYVFADLLKRTLGYNNFTVKHVMNITDLGDKTIHASQEKGQDLKTFTRSYEEKFFTDCAQLNIIRPDVISRASENIKPMIDLVTKLLDSGYAYQADDGVYFSIAKAKNYGALANLSVASTAVSRIKNDEYDKDSHQDFALWKFTVPNDGPNSWPTSFGTGRPGWHIECSAMSMHELGETFDIHTGGIDLIFPHHTNEIAQSEAATDKPFVHYWLHSGHVLVDGQKMSKSLGNIKILSDLPVLPLAYRYWLLTAHYRRTVNLTNEALTSAQTAYEKLKDVVATGLNQAGQVLPEWKEKFINLINDDLNTPEALALIWTLVKDSSISAPNKTATILDFDQVLGLKLEAVTPPSPIPDNIQKLAQDREVARKDGDWAKADEIRAQIKVLGYEVDDTPQGPKITKS